MAKLCTERADIIASDEVGTVLCSHGHWGNRALRGGILTLVFLTTALSVCGQVSVTTSRYNNQRTNVNANETILTPANVNSTIFGKLFSQPVDGYVFAQPLYVPDVTINGAVHNVVYVATEHDSVYAFDADTSAGANAQPLWHDNFLLPGATTVSSGDVGCQDIVPEYGITGTPVIDLSTNILYVVSDALENNGANYVKRFHALDITTGAEKPGSPIIISASVTVPGQSPYTFDTEWEHQRPGLLLYNGVVYIGFGSHCDNYDERGWILGYSYSGSSFSQVFVFSDEPSSVNGREAGIWMGGEGLPMDWGSNLFVATGNGQFDTDITPPVNYGDSIVRIDLSQGPAVQDYFAPWDQSTEDVNDLDLGSGGIVILPDQPGPYPHLLVQAGKEAVIHVVNRDNMGQFNFISDNIVQEITGIGGIFSSPAYFNGEVYFWGVNDVLKAFTVANGMLSTSPTDEGPDVFGYPGANPTVSANGTANGIVWALNSSNWSKTGPGGPGVLYAYNASNLAAGSLYNSFQNGGRDNTGGAIKWATPTVANGKVYVEAEGELSVYGELGAGGGTAPAITSANNTTFTVGTAGSFTVSTTGIPAPSLTETGTLPGGVTFQDNGNGSGTLSGTPGTSTGGTYPLTITATNDVGTPATQNLTLTVNTTAPVITSGTTATGTVGAAFSYQITATNTPTSYGATGLPAGLTVSSGTGLISGTPTTAGTSTVTLSATNSGGTGNATLTLTINAAAPVITSGTTASGTVGTAFSYQITATNTPTGYGATGLPAALTVNTGAGLISGTPTTAGTSTVTLSATNSGGTGTATLTLTINTTVPVITSATTATGTVGTALSYQITATNTPTSYKATGLPAGLTVSSKAGLILGRPTAEGTSTVTLCATNSSGTGNATLTLTISGPSPVITSAKTTSGTIGTAFSYQITATNTPTSYGATGLPAGLTVNSGTGLISGTPTTAGTSTVTLSATNSNGTGNATLTLTISGPSPVITSAKTASGTVGTAFSYQITATNTPTSYGATGLPAGLTVNSGTGLISGTPTAAGTSAVTLSATNADGTGNASLRLRISSP